MISAHRHVGPREIALEVLHVGDVRAAKRVDRLVVVADREHRRVRSPASSLQPLVLQHVGVLELVDQQVREAAPVVLAQAVVLREQLVAAQQQLGEIDDAFALAHRLVERVVLDLAPRELVAGLDLVRAQALLLRAGDEVLQLPRRKALVVDAVRLVQPLDQRELVLRVHDLEELRQVRVAVVRAQHPVAQAVERADPHAARVDRRHRREADEHLLRRLVGERDGEDRQRRRLAGREQPRDARRQHARLAAAGAGEDQRRCVRQRDGGELLGIEVGEERGSHRERGRSRLYGAGGAIIRASSATPSRRFRRPLSMPPNPNAAPPAHSATTRAFVQWIRSAAPYIHAFRGKTFVIAFGGEVVADDTFLGIIHDLNLLHSLGVHLVVVHGSRPQIEAILAQQDIESRYAFGLRVTDAETMDCVLEADGQVRCAHRGAALARHRQLADGGRAHPRVVAAISSPPSRWACSTASTCS